MSDISTTACSITRTARGRYFWAAWWTGAPCHLPFRKPDASNGGAASEAEALAAAEKIAGRHLTSIDPYWARAWKAKLQGETPPKPPSPANTRAAAASRDPKARVSSWSVLGLKAGSALDEVKRAYRKRALETHPDQGGDANAFLEVQRAYERLVERLGRNRPQKGLKPRR